MSLFPWVLPGGFSLAGGPLLVLLLWHMLWLGTLVGVAGALLRVAMRSAGPELRYLIALMTFGSLIGAAAVAVTLAATTSPSAVMSPGRTAFFSAISFLWLGGVLLSAGTLLCGLWGTVRLGRRDSGETPAPILEASRHWQDVLRLSHTIRVALSDRVRVPCAIGVLHPVILLPRSAAEWSPRQIDHVLIHELGHIRRQDLLVIFCQRLLETVFWFHPVVWTVSRWLDEDREHCCDEFVLVVTHDPHDYAATLLALASAPQPVLLAGISLNQKPLQLRIRRILFREESMMFRPRAREIAAALPCGALWCLLLLPDGAGAEQPTAVVVQPTPQTLPETTTIESVQASMLRRVLIDLTGRQPTPREFEAYLAGNKTLGQIAQEATALNNRTAVTTEIDKRLTELARIVKRNWGPEQVIGAPDTAIAGDQITAWASLSQDGQEEWLICDFGKDVAAATVRVHETYNPGSLIKITFLDEKNEETLAWEGEDPTPRDQPKGISIIPVNPEKPVKRIKLYFDSVAFPGWNEIDAVGLADADGTINWTVAATASTTFAEPAGSSTTPDLASWSPAQAAGEPNTPQAGDAITAWASASVDGQEEWLICNYAALQQPTEIVIHETYNPGAVTKITAFDEDGTEHIAWEGEDPTPRDQPRGVSVFPVKLAFPTKRIKVYIDSVSVPGWNEIDAVGLRNAEGQTAWAAEVEASSTYATLVGGGVPTTTFINVPAVDYQKMEMEIQELKQAVQELKGLRDEIKEIKDLLKKQQAK